jgi:DNA polymerase-1
MTKPTTRKGETATDEAQGTLFDATNTERAEANGYKVVVIDGHALAYRSYFAIRDLHTSRGRPVNAIYGFVRSLLRILKEEGEHDATVVTFDAAAKTFRHDQFEAYKAGRAPTPADFPEQLATIKQLVDLLGLQRLEVSGLEADDLIGTIAVRCAQAGYAVEIVTSDRDAYQLVNDRITVRGLDKRERFGPKEVLAKYGVSVEQWTDYRALTGDSADNIPGARGIGPKGAQKLLARYGSLDYILEHLDDIEPASYAEKIRASLEDVKLSRELSRIVTDADIDCDVARWAKREMQRNALKALLNELEFGSILRELELSETSHYQETDLIALGDTAEVAVGFVLSSSSARWATLEQLALAAAGKVAEADEGQLGHLDAVHACDAKALCVYAKGRGYALSPGDDPLLMAYLLDPNTTSPEAVARRYGAGEWGEHAKARAAVTAELLKLLPPLLSDRQRELYETLERPLQAVLADMEFTGITVDSERLKAQSQALGDKLAELEARAREIAGDERLNLNSRDQVAALLFEKLRLQAGKKTATGKLSTAMSALEPLREQHEIVGMILDYRELSKLKSTYLDPLPKLVHPETGRVHTTFNQAVVATGRLSSTNPNLQNIPVRTDVGREIRRAFIAAEGCKLLVADYSQIELRVLAHIAGEEALIEAFRRGEDIHRRTAAQVYGVTMDEVTPAQRRVAKVINFGVLYGMSAHRLTRELGIEYDEAERFIASYFAGYPKVRRYIDETLARCRETGYVETLLGRRRMIPDINSNNRNAREYAERTAYNMPIQGTAADIMKLAMLKLHPLLQAEGAALLLQVHDEIVVECPAAKAAEVASKVKTAMESAFELAVPLMAEVGIGDNWLDAK